MGDTETAGRRHHVEFVAGLQFVRGPVRERAAIDLFHGDPQLAIVRPRADRIGTAHFLAVHGGAQSEVLPRREAVVVLQLLRDRKRHRHRIRGFAAEIVDGETVKARCVGHHQSSSVIARSGATKQSILSFRGDMDCFASLAMTDITMASMTFEIIKRFAAALAAPQRLAGGRAKFGQQLGIPGAALRTGHLLFAEQRAARI